MLICTKCKNEYEDGKNFCGVCGGPLVNKEDFVLNEEKKEPEEEKQIERLICPSCRLLYEKMTICIRCGATLVKEIPTQQEEAEIPYILDVEKEELQSASSPEVKKEEFRDSYSFEVEKKPHKPATSPEVKKEEFRDSYSFEVEKKPQKRATSPEAKREPIKPSYSPEVKKESRQIQTPEKQPAEQILEGMEGEISPPEKSKKKFLPLSLGGLSIFFLIAIGIFFLWSIYSYFAPKSSGPSTSHSEEATSVTRHHASPSANQTTTVAEPKEEKEQPAQGPPSINESIETEGIRVLLEKIRQANLQKNINLFMSCYATDFKNREEKKRATLEAWNNFNYLDLSYVLKDYSISRDTAQARVEWLIKFYLKEGSGTKENRSILDVTFNKEDGGWKIKEIRTTK
jgi:RNA polymerase subunit RPABC4/transcription elongation factor Spt4